MSGSGLRISRVILSCAGLISAVALAQSTGSAPNALNAAASAKAAPLEPLASQLTLEESIDMLGGVGFGTRAVPRLAIPSFSMSDGPSGVRSPGPSTAYAAGIGLAASWDAELAQEVGRQLGRDARARGSQYLLGPGVNIYRAPMNGRNFEYFGEDPWLGSRIAVGYIRGVQEEGVSATVKHFAGNNSEFARHTSDSLIEERALREIYLPIFEAAVKEAHVGAVMSSYNLTNGEHMSANEYLTHQVLRNQWKFDGVLMSDWGGTYDGVAATLARQDLEMPTGRFTNRETLLPAIRAGKVSAALITESVRNQLRLADRFQWTAHLGPDLSVPRLNPQGNAAAYRGAVEGAVLLKNNNGILPIDAKRVKTVAVIGPTAHPTPATAGGSGHVPPFTEVSLLEGLSAKLGPDVKVTYAPGLAPPTIQNQLTRFSTDATGQKPGVNVEVFASDTLTGEPQERRVEPQFSTGNGGVQETLSVFEWLPPDAAEAWIAGLINARPPRSYERWTGWYTPSTAGAHTLSIQASGSYRLFLDDQLVMDSTRIPKAELLQLKQTFTATPHKVVFEQASARDFGRPSWRVNIVRDGTYVQPLAKSIAAQADVVIIAAGFDSQNEGEGADRDFALPPGQEELIREISAINPNTVVVLTGGGAVDVRSWVDRIPALLMAWYPGQEGGSALAALLLGEANPSGRLPISWERNPEDNPTHENYYYNDGSKPNAIAYREGVFVGYRGYQKAGRKPQFPFGFGLSYTTFTYANLSVQAVPSSEARSGALYRATFDVTNSGPRDGSDVPQLYVGEVRSRVARPTRELKGFARIALKAGETRKVSVPLDARSFAYFDLAGRSWRADRGSYRVEIGKSAEDIVASTTVAVPRNLTAPP